MGARVGRAAIARATKVVTRAITAHPSGFSQALMSLLPAPVFDARTASLGKPGKASTKTGWWARQAGLAQPGRDAFASSVVSDASRCVRLARIPAVPAAAAPAFPQISGYTVPFDLALPPPTLLLPLITYIHSLFHCIPPISKPATACIVSSWQRLCSHRIPPATQHIYSTS